MVAAMTAALALSAQENGKSEWFDRMKSEKIAFFTAEMDITPAEAQVFWPVYNDIEKQMLSAHEAEYKALKEMNKAIEDGRSDKEVEALLVRYTDARRRMLELESEAATRLRKALPATKIARMFVAEEKFRRHQFSKLGDHRDGKQPAPRP